VRTLNPPLILRIVTTTKVVTRAQQQSAVRSALERVLACGVAELLCLLAALLMPVRVLWIEPRPTQGRRLYFANHTSHGDFLLLWAALPRSLRRRVRPVAAADYWHTGRMRRFLIDKVFRGVTVDRRGAASTSGAIDPVAAMARAARAGDALVIFPEGCRNTSAAALLPFKSGLYRLACLVPELELVPVWLGNVNRALPKGAVIPLPVLCTVTFGPALTLQQGESKDEFLRRARHALLALAVSRPRHSAENYRCRQRNSSA